MATGLAEAGAKVVIIGSSAAAEKSAQALREKGLDVTGLRGDLSDREGLPALFDRAVELLGGGIDILLNDAGVQRRNHCEDFTLEDWDAVLNVNLTTVFVLCQLAGRKMLAQGGGKIINMASILGFFRRIHRPGLRGQQGWCGSADQGAQQ